VVQAERRGRSRLQEVEAPLLIALNAGLSRRLSRDGLFDE
jgi:hypothetical protein